MYEREEESLQSSADVIVVGAPGHFRRATTLPHYFPRMDMLGRSSLTARGNKGTYIFTSCECEGSVVDNIRSFIIRQAVGTYGDGRVLLPVPTCHIYVISSARTSDLPCLRETKQISKDIRRIQLTGRVMYVKAV